MADARPPFRSGFIGMAGVPNAGKSTLVNRLTGQKVSIMSHCPQTTRHRVCGIMSTEEAQAVFVDLPGILPARNSFNLALVGCAESSLRDCDLIIHLRDPRRANPEEEGPVISFLQNLKQPLFLVWNKMDMKAPVPLPPDPPGIRYEATYRISAKTGRGVEALQHALIERLPEGPLLYPADDASDRDLRFLCAEMVREKAFLHLHDEIPHGIATWTELWEERPDGLIHIEIIIQTEREAHKGIILGARGDMIKRIGTEARRDIEKLCGQAVYLDLRVQVRERWRSNPAELERLGLRAHRR